MFRQLKVNFKDWLGKASIRAVKTVAETALSVIGTSYVISDVNWLVVVSASALSGIVSLLISLKGLPEFEEVTESELDLEIERSDNNEPY